MAHRDYCILHKKVEHATEHCKTLKWLVHRKEKEGVLVLDSKAKDVEEEPYPDHNKNARHRAHVIISEGGEASQLSTMREDSSFEEGESSIHHYSKSSVHQVSRLMDNQKFRSFFDSMGFTEAGRYAATSALIKIAAAMGTECFIATEDMYKRPSLLFTDDDIFIPMPHSHPLFVDIEINGLKLHRALVDTGASLNMMSTRVFECLAIPRDRLIKGNTMVTGVTGEGRRAEGYITLDVMVGPYLQSIRFQVLEADTDYWHVILGRPWLNGTRAVASTFHQCLKFWHKGKEVKINASEEGLRQEVYIVEMVNRREQGLPPLAKRSHDITRMMSVPLPDEEGTLDRQRQRNKTRRREGGNRPELCRTVVHPDGRVTYHL